MAEYAALDKLGRALSPLPSAALDGAHQLNVSGTVNIIGGGSGGTSMIDNNPFTPGSTSITPMGGYFGPRTISSGNAAAPALSNSGIMLVDVRAGGAGGGVANITVRGSANSDLHVGYASGAAFNNDGGAYLPVLGTVNVGNSLTITGSVNITGSLNPVGVLGSVSVTGSVNAVLGTLPVPVVGSIFTTPIATQTVWYGGGFADTTNSAIRVNVVTGGAGGGNANLEVRGTANTDIHVGFASGAGLYADGGAALPVLGTVNIVGGGSGFATAAVYGSPAFPVYNIGSVNIVNTVTVTGTVNTVGGGAGGGFASVAVYGSPAMPVYIVGSVNVVNQAANSGFASVAVYGSPANPVYNVGSVNVVNNVGIFGSVNVLGTTTLGAIATVNLGLGTVNIGNAPNMLASLAGIAAAGSGALDVDPRANLVGTQWIISFGGSGQSSGIAGSIANQRVYFSAYHLVATATVDMQWMSPSGVAITGSFRLLPGAGFALAGQLPAGPVLMGSLGSQIFLAGNAVGNIGGVAVGWIGT